MTSAPPLLCGILRLSGTSAGGEPAGHRASMGGARLIVSGRSRLAPPRGRPARSTMTPDAAEAADLVVAERTPAETAQAGEHWPGNASAGRGRRDQQQARTLSPARGLNATPRATPGMVLVGVALVDADACAISVGLVVS